MKHSTPDGPGEVGSDRIDDYPALYHRTTGVMAMSRTLSESDWKIFRQLREIALERFCRRVLSEIAGLSTDAPKTSHERYLAIHRHMKQCDEELASAFDDPRRSTALRQLGCIQAYKLLTEEEMRRFSPEARAAAEIIAGIRFGSGG